MIYKYKHTYIHNDMTPNRPFPLIIRHLYTYSEIRKIIIYSSRVATKVVKSRNRLIKIISRLPFEILIAANKYRNEKDVHIDVHIQTVQKI